MTEDEFWSATPQLTLIHQWARARYAAPWAVFVAVLLRVVTGTGPHVQLPGIIGGRASLNLLAVFVAPSGGGKGISDKVARLAWPADVHEEGLGSGQGIAELFKATKNPEDRIDRAIFSVSEVDHLTALDAGRENNTRATLKAAAMGERLGSKGASAVTSRTVPPHSYRMCLSVGGQPGHCGVILDDATGGTPQRFLWVPSTDPTMPAERTPDPAPLNHRMPGYLTRVHDGTDIVTEVKYGADVIADTILASHLARQRGEGDALDGHWTLLRCKVAAAIALMHHREVVGELEWELSAVVMAISDRTRAGVIEHAARATRAKIRERALARATGEDFYDASRLETVKRSLLRMLDRDGEQAGGDLRRRLGKREKRELFEQAMSLLEVDGLVSSRPGEHHSVRYRIGSPVTTEVTPDNRRSERVTSEVTRDHHDSGSVSENASSSPLGPLPSVDSAEVWLRSYIAANADPGGWVEVSQLRADAESAGYPWPTMRTARRRINGRPIVSSNRGKNSLWRLEPDCPADESQQTSEVAS